MWQKLMRGSRDPSPAPDTVPSVHNSNNNTASSAVGVSTSSPSLR